MIMLRKETFLSFRLICLTDAMLIWQRLISNKRIIFLSYDELGRANTNRVSGFYLNKTTVHNA